MPTRDRTPLGAPTWIDLMSADTDRSRAFYGELFGWECEEGNPEFGGYANFTKDGVRVAGLMAKMEEALPDVWSVYLEVADAEKTIAAVEALGLPVFVPAMPVGDLGVMGVVADPGGAMIGMWQSGEHTGFGVLDEPGTPNWFELHTREYDRCLPFYRDVFGWDTHTAADEPGFRYTTLGKDDDGLAGVMDNAGDLPEGAPSFWIIYFDVESADATAAKVVALGGSVQFEPTDTPYGRLASFADPTGAMFSVRQVLAG
jgi:predicted enzyme related to lactoylglutathione lyase